MSVLSRFVERVRAVKFRRASSEPGLPAAAQLVAVQHPSATLPERPYDLWLLAAVLGLLGLGTIEIYSATAADSLTHYGDSMHFLERQIGYVLCGGIAMWIGVGMGYRRLKDWSYPLPPASVLLLGVGLPMPSKTVAKRGSPLGPLTFQPGEIAKLALVTYLAC